ncbi:flagellar hook protein FlgE [Pseudomonas psychrotolerans L19]|uniref:flagellar hook protein FlgE n=1 Tax=Pseudomonas oryzihabitans TaxID=47885 RepID=UPI00023A130F|nr:MULTISPECIES: flagellar hook protein FlgE [Pseudomonas]EHK71091.1 flagellar hook protein FlgE [Pseudomonas psychrotolerans L19]MBA1182725.1 flagellar hook protein FlgE [Pseudomonas psychrotolerans]MBA1211993.1 flagellar hook protein FlgE [Pseudomonas psychrotolerans]HCV77673.1 flagellar hook protein FlgE [Pseudomonas sp.]
MSFNIGLSGIKAASSDLNITGNNIANASTVGFKQSRAEFQDLYAASVLGTGKNSQGSGVLLGNVGQLFNQGTIDSTQNALDMGINGNGFFVTSNNGAVQYTRAGYFGTDKEGFIVDNNGYKLQGYTTNAQGLLQPGVRSDLRVETASQAPKASSSIKQTVNLNSTQTTPTTTPFNPSDPTSYNSSTSVNIYDSQGNAHVLSQYFVKGANNSWTMNVLIDGRNPGNPAAEDPTTKVATPYTVTLPFTSSGALDGSKVASTDLKQVNNATTNTFEGVLKLDNWVPAISNGGTPATWASNGATANPAGITLDMRGSTQYSSAFAVTSVNQDGYTTGQLSGLEIDDTGQIFARYTNGQSKVQGQVVLANFANVQGLTPMGKTSWTESSESGQPVIGTPRSGTLGALQSGALEASNVDISTELVDMIVAQRNYQANAKTIETENAITQTIINLR